MQPANCPTAATSGASLTSAVTSFDYLHALCICCPSVRPSMGFGEDEMRIAQDWRRVSGTCTAWRTTSFRPPAGPCQGFRRLGPEAVASPTCQSPAAASCGKFMGVVTIHFVRLHSASLSSALIVMPRVDFLIQSWLMCRKNIP